MNIHELTPIEIKRTDPITGVEHTFTANPPIDLNIWDLKPGIAAKDFIVLLLWQIKAGIWDTGSFENLIEQTTEVLPLINQVVGEVGFYVEDATQMLERVKPGEKTRVKPGDRFGYHYYVKPLVNSEPIDELTPSDEMLRVLCKEVLHSLPLEVAVSWFIDLNKAELDRRAEEINDVAVSWFDEENKSKQSKSTQEFKEKNLKGSTDADIAELGKKKTLFPNSKDFGSNHTGMAKALSDGIVTTMKKMSRSLIEEQYIDSRRRRVAFKTQDHKGRTAEISLDREALGVTNLNECVKQLWQLKNAKILQTFHVLWNYATNQDNATFHNVPISELMEMVLKPSGKNKFNKEDRKAFTEGLKWMDSMTITVNQIKEEWNPKTNKTKTVLTQERGIKVFQMKATYSIKKQYQSLPKDQLKEETHFDMDVINHFSGKLLPGSPELFMDRANRYNNNLLKLDANKDGKAYILGFIIETRFNQVADKLKPIEIKREQLIDTCDYQKTNDSKPSIATKLLTNSMKKLIQHGIISGHGPITNNNQDMVIIYRPKLSKEKVLE